MEHNTCILAFGNYDGGLTGLSAPSQAKFMDADTKLN